MQGRGGPERGGLGGGPAGRGVAGGGGGGRGAAGRGDAGRGGARAGVPGPGAGGRWGPGGGGGEPRRRLGGGTAGGAGSRARPRLPSGVSVRPVASSAGDGWAGCRLGSASASAWFRSRTGIRSVPRRRPGSVSASVSLAGTTS